MDKNEIKNIVESYYAASSNVYRECVKFLKEFLADKGVYEFDDENELITISYDGGNHPEYAANPFCRVESITLKGNDVVVSCEEDEEYSIINGAAEDICRIVEYILSH